VCTFLVCIFECTLKDIHRFIAFLVLFVLLHSHTFLFVFSRFFVSPFCCMFVLFVSSFYSLRCIVGCLILLVTLFYCFGRLILYFVCTFLLLADCFIGILVIFAFLFYAGHILALISFFIWYACPQVVSQGRYLILFSLVRFIRIYVYICIYLPVYSATGVILSAILFLFYTFVILFMRMFVLPLPCLAYFVFSFFTF